MTRFSQLKFAALTCLLTFNSYAQIIFETDFANDGSFYATQQQSSWTEVAANKPTGFDGALIEGKDIFKACPARALAVLSPLNLCGTTLGQPVSQLYKHLTGNQNTGYDEIYIRYCTDGACTDGSDQANLLLILSLFI